MPNSELNLFSVEELADQLKITPRAVRHRILAGQIKAQKIGKGRTSAYVIERSEVDRVLREHAA